MLKPQRHGEDAVLINAEKRQRCSNKNHTSTRLKQRDSKIGMVKKPKGGLTTKSVYYKIEPFPVNSSLILDYRRLYLRLCLLAAELFRPHLFGDLLGLGEDRVDATDHVEGHLGNLIVVTHQQTGEGVNCVL